MVTPYLRVTEIGTTSAEGHAHFHFWAVLPYVPHVVFRRLWGEALRDVPYVPIRRVVDLEAEARERWESDPSRLKRELANIDAVARPRRDSRERRAWVPWPVVHVRPADNVETELVKYLVKDLVPEDEGAQYVDPMQFAEWYAALEGRRLVTASCGFWRDEPEAHCRVCGSVGCLRLVIPKQAPQTGAGSERGPPPLATAP